MIKLREIKGWDNLMANLSYLGNDEFSICSYQRLNNDSRIDLHFLAGKGKELAIESYDIGWIGNHSDLKERLKV